jgi:cellulose synthase/poly-beta-1,6-N-acetylglucosamine synthase-like glycosyltransferase
MKLTIIVPTYNRQFDLIRCLGAIAEQERLADQVLVVARRDDLATLELLTEWNAKLPLTVKYPELSGQVNALNAGLSAAVGDVIAITDDDAAPRRNWLKMIEQHFERDSHVGAVGGRDWLHYGSDIVDGSEKIVGKVTWFGRLIGNHHLGVGPAREVDFLKGANMSYRHSAIEHSHFDTRLRGVGAQVSNDMAFSMAVKARGWKLLYDPEVAVDHFPAPRLDLDVRGVFNSISAEHTAFNQYWAIATSLSSGFRRSAARVFQFLIGSRALPGYLHLLWGFVVLDPNVTLRWKAANNGRRAARAQLRKKN